MTILSYLFYFIASSISPLQRRALAKRKDPEARDQIMLAFQVMVILTLGSLVLLFFNPLYFSGGVLKLGLLTLVCAIFGMTYFILMYGAQKHVEAGVTNVVSNVYTPMAIVLSSIFLHEGLNKLEILGTVFLLVGMIIISNKHRISRFKFDKYFTAMVMGSICLGILLVAERALQIQTGLAAATLLSWGAQCLFLGMATLFAKSRKVYTNKEILITGSLTFLSSLSYVILVFVVGNLSFIVSITNFKVVIITGLAAIFLHERNEWGRKVVGSILATLGLLLMK
jgi:drug/metabolite transporter (DMT)-like permease